MDGNVIVLMGINGVGKSSLSQGLARILPDAVSLSGSQLLMQALGCLSRAQLERLSAEEKMRWMVPAVLEAFERQRERAHLILDTHLIVFIRQAQTLLLENAWSPAYHPYVRHVFLVTSPAQSVFERRRRDFARQGRERHLALEHIQRDQQITSEVFSELIVPALPASVVINREDRLERTIACMQERLARWEIGARRLSA